MDLAPAGAGRVGDHVGVSPVGLGLPRVQIGGAAHHQPGDVGDRHATGGGDRDRQLGDRAGLVDRQAGLAVPGRGVDQPLEIGLVDELGDLDDAIARAAELAEMDNWRSVDVLPPLDPQSLIMMELMNDALGQSVLAQWLSHLP